MRLKGIYNRGEILYNGFVPYRWETEYPADIREKCRFPWFLKSRKRDFYENEELITITKELADTLRKNKTIDWQKRESARAKMRMLIKKLLKKHKYPPEGMDDAVQTVMTQCELWTDNYNFEEDRKIYSYINHTEETLPLVAEDRGKYN